MVTRRRRAPSPAPPRLYRVIIPVPDVDAATAFYTKVLGIPGERVSAGRHYFSCGGTILACYSPEADSDPIGSGWRFHSSQYVYFATANVGLVFRRVKAAGGTVEGPIARMPWGERMFWARDPFGTPISFVDEKTVFTGWSRRRKR